MGGDLAIIFYWWLILFGIGVVFYPLTDKLLGAFWDKGYGLSKVFGLLLVSYVVWLLGSLKALPFENKTIWLVILGAMVGSFWLFNKRREEFKKEIRKNWRLFAFEEGLFFLSLTCWSFIRGFQPDIHGLEKFMDFGFVNSVLRAKYFPPLDMWLAGETINYYYFGHLITAVLTKLAGIDSAISYNLMIATLFAFVFTAGFSLGANLLNLSQRSKTKNQKLIIISGVLIACLLALGGNLHPLWYLIKHGNYRAYWYPDATRFIVELFGAADNTIHEFPIYSFVVADLHGHLLNLPFVLLFLALLLVVFSSSKTSLYFYLVASLFLGTFFMTNAWDFAIYNLVFGTIILLFNYLKYKFSFKTVLQTAKVVFPVFIGSLIFSLPFHLNFKKLVEGIALADFRSPFWMLLVLWGFPLFTTLIFILRLAIKRNTNEESRFVDIFVLALLGVSWFLIVFPEFFYLKDIYIHSYQRANTMFKLTYQSFVMFYLTAVYIFIRILLSLKQKILKLLLISGYSSLLVFILIYPNFAIRSYYGLRDYKGLYGLNFLERLYRDDYQAILWLRKNIIGQLIVVEAIGESYTDFARVSANTGLPTVLGWRVHEWLWRGSFDEVGKRTEEVREIYEGSDLQKTKLLLNKYQVKFIFLGDLERRQYPNLNEQKLEKLGETVFSAGKTKVFEIK